MTTPSPDPPGWTFTVDEVSASVFKVVARDWAGRTVERTGADPKALLEECRVSARAMDQVPTGGRYPSSHACARLKSLLSRGVPLVEFACVLKKGISGEVACEAVNRLSADLIGYVQGNPGDAWGRSLIVQMDPRAASSLGVALARVPLRPDHPSIGYKWESYGLGQLGALTSSIIEDIQVSTPGQFDGGQTWP